MTVEGEELYVESWREAAACAGTTEVNFFPDPADLAAVSRAKAMCATCPVAGECLTWAIETNQTEGIWGGHTPAERRALRRRWLEEIRRAS
ncbi:MAG TPA: WhiB family transcriptional regulator [Acidimicrobiia bacterium]|jgi:WhiB family redox-sensing transcriptional regulator|nr:WhiB family transcriptional regulator [Acidimicrobiia bacterium]